MSHLPTRFETVEAMEDFMTTPSPRLIWPSPLVSICEKSCCSGSVVPEDVAPEAAASVASP